MHITPKRRQRILSAHHLRQQGHSLRQIAQQLGVSHATVIADLKLLETHWSEIAAPAADERLLEQLHQLTDYLAHVLNQDLVQLFGDRLSGPELARLMAIRASEISALFRETRQTINAIHRRAAARPSDDLDLPDESVEDPPELTNANHSNHRVSQPEQEIVTPERSENTSPNHPDQPLPDDIFEQAQAFLEQLSEHEFPPAELIRGPSREPAHLSPATPL